MMTATELQTRIRNLNERARSLRASLDETIERLSESEYELKRLEYTCGCVRLNRDIGIFGAHQQLRSGRSVLYYGGLVADALTAERACPICNGTGKPQ